MAEAKQPGMNGIRDMTLRWAHRPTSTLDLAGKRIVIVGGTGGLGRAIARTAASRGARVTVIGQTFRDEGTANLDFVRADLSRLREASKLGETITVDGLDVLVLTTGIFAGPTREVTDEGLERDMAVSYLSRLALLRALAPRLVASGTKARVFVMGFPGAGNAGVLGDLNAERAYKSMEVHMNTVAGNEALVLDAVKRYPQLTFVGLNPGLIKTNIRANVLGGEGSMRQRVVEAMIGLFTPTPERYAERIVPLLFAPELDGRSGAMFNQKVDAILPSPGLTAERVSAFLGESDALVARALAIT
jgi:NAD(P)-dependent dehydrogenase (short-subunit alcohol dehydrogenase family)